MHSRIVECFYDEHMDKPEVVLAKVKEFAAQHPINASSVGLC